MHWVLRCGISLWPGWVTCPSSAPSRPVLVPPLLAENERQKSSWFRINTRHQSVISIILTLNPNTELCQLLRWDWLYPSPNWTPFFFTFPPILVLLNPPGTGKKTLRDMGTAFSCWHWGLVEFFFLWNLDFHSPFLVGISDFPPCLQIQ